MLEKLHQPPPVRGAPDAGERDVNLALLRAWATKNGDREVRWWNNVPLAIREILRSGVSLDVFYRALDASLFADFDAWRRAVHTVDIQARSPACVLAGEVRTVRVPERRQVTIALEDVLLHAHAYEQLVTDTLACSPAWIPFFFRGGIGPGMELVARLFDIDRNHPLLSRIHWLPGLGHSREEVGADPKHIFKDLLEQKLRSSKSPTFHLWVVDTTLTGSSAISALKGVLDEVDLGGHTLDVTFAALVPVEVNVKKKIALVPPGERLPLPWRSAGGLPTFVARVYKPNSVRTFDVRLYGVARTLTDDIPEVAELEYLPPAGSAPRYGVFVHDVTLTVTKRTGGSHTVDLTDLAGRGGRTDSVHDWLFNVANPARLHRILAALGEPCDVQGAAERLFADRAFAQYASGPHVYSLETRVSHDERVVPSALRPFFDFVRRLGLRSD